MKSYILTDVYFRFQMQPFILKVVKRLKNYSMRIFLCGIALFLFGFTFSQEKYTVSGYINSGETGEELIGGQVKVEEKGVGTIANVYGFYSITLPEGNYKLTYSYVGYRSVSIDVELTQNFKKDIELFESSEVLKDVLVVGEASNSNVDNVEMSVEKLDIEQVKKIPALMGEVDIIKAIQLLPGVQTVGEGGSGFFVRGGAADQNLVLLDEANVYNASHLMGFFSVFNPDVIKDLQLYKGGIPAQYGGRLSSVLDIRMKDGNSKKFAMQGGVGTISSRITVEAPIIKNKSSFVLSARRTYADIFLGLSKKEGLKESKLYFYDLNLKANYKFNDNNRLFLSGYFGRDVFGFSDVFRMDWGNGTGTVRWNHIFNNKLFLNTSVIASKYNYYLGQPSGNDGFEWTSGINDYNLKFDFNYYLNPNNTLKFGLQSGLHNFDPGVAKGSGESVFDEYRTPKSNAIDYALYVSNKHKIGTRLTAVYGLRYSLFQNIGKGTVYGFDENYNVLDTSEYEKGEIYNTYGGFEPRLGLRYAFNEKNSIKASYNRTRQYIQLASNSTSASPLDIWFPSSPNVKPQIADQVAAGYFRNFKNNRYEASVELYYKVMQNTIDFKDHATLLLNPYLEGELRVGSAYAYGAEFLVKKQKGKLTGWVSYTLARVEKQITEINDGNRYPAKYDKTHDVSVVASYEISKRLDASLTWVYSTGSAVTMPIARYEYQGMIIPVYSERNAERLPAYHRMDASITLKGKKKDGKRFSGDWVFSVYNAYNRANAFSINFRQSEADPTITEAEMMYLFGIVPAITYNFKF